MIIMNKIVTFQVSRGNDGYYVASASDFGIVTQGKTFEALVCNIREAIEVSLEEIVGKQTKKSFPPVMMNMDFSRIAYA